MSELAAFFRLGVGHILSVDALDHVLFLLALAAIYRGRDWRRVLWVVSSFTVGHSITLALAATGMLQLPTPAIEFLIPLTIVATCVENLVARDRGGRAPGRFRPALAGVFGLVHGAGFAAYLRDLFVDHPAVPLLGFNLGIELGQVVVLLALALAFAAVDPVIAAAAATWRGGASVAAPARLRAVAISTVVGVVAVAWAVERRPW